jgi:hypothetical protein
MFWRRSLFEKAGGLNLNYKLAVDFELWIKFAQLTDLYFVDLIFSSFMVRKESISSVNQNKYYTEVIKIIENKENLPFMGWNILNKVHLNHIFSIFIFEKTPILRFSRKTNDLVLKNTYRSVSCQSIFSLFKYLINP